ncbi:MAG: OB-fold nucleic acid binding domain-containing protein [Cellulosilyticaceae bacterium]
MQIVRDLAGYSLGRSDLLRRAMGKKKTEVMAKERDIFLNGDGENVPGCIANGIPEDVGNQIFDDMIDFAKYAFNKSHAAAYAVVAYQTAYLKTYYKVEFMAALMTSLMDSSGKIRQYIDNCKKNEIQVVAPDINLGYAYFSTKDNIIMYGLAAIKNVGRNVIDKIVEEREANGLFTSLNDFYNRMDAKDTNKRCIESLIFAGAFDTLGGKRSQYFTVYKQIADGIAISKKKNIEGQINLFAIEQSDEIITQKDILPNISEFDMKEILNYEKEVLGIYLSGHPLDKVSNQLRRYISHQAIDLEITEEQEHCDGEKVIVGGLVVEKKIIFTKNNKKMAFITLEDTTGTIECIIFPNLYEKFVKFDETHILLVKGHLSIKEDEAAVVLGDELTTLEAIINPENEAECVILKLTEAEQTKEMSQKLINIFIRYPGKYKVVVETVEDGSKKAFPQRYNISLGEKIIHELNEVIESRCIVVPKNT